MLCVNCCNGCNSALTKHYIELFYLFSVVRSANQSVHRVPAEYAARDVTEDTCVAEVLPSWRMPGLCATVLIHKMAAIQNALLEEYHTLVTRTE